MGRRRGWSGKAFGLGGRGGLVLLPTNVSTSDKKKWIRGGNGLSGGNLVYCVFGDVDEEEGCHVRYHKRLYPLRSSL